MTTPFPDVTVTVIVHNDAERLPRAIASVRAQTHRDIEIVISDDHSTDATPQVAAELAAQTTASGYCGWSATAAVAARPATGPCRPPARPT